MAMACGPNLSIPRSRVKEFQRYFNDTSGLRVGQAFHQFMQLEKVISDKTFCDRLYQADGDRAWSMILSLVDESN